MITTICPECEAILYEGDENRFYCENCSKCYEMVDDNLVERECV